MWMLNTSFKSCVNDLDNTTVSDDKFKKPNDAWRITNNFWMEIVVLLTIY